MIFLFKIFILSKFNFRNQNEDNMYKELMSKVTEDEPFKDVGVTIVSGSNLPRHSDHHRCYLRGSTIQVNIIRLISFCSCKYNFLKFSS